MRKCSVNREEKSRSFLLLKPYPLETCALGRLWLEVVMPRKRTRLTQAQLDRIIRKAAGNNAIEELISASPAVQKYLLGDGSILSVRTATGRTHRKGARS
jgi:hypothetical protein